MGIRGLLQGQVLVIALVGNTVTAKNDVTYKLNAETVAGY
jgi:hypothetical protein